MIYPACMAIFVAKRSTYNESFSSSNNNNIDDQAMLWYIPEGTLIF